MHFPSRSRPVVDSAHRGGTRERRREFVSRLQVLFLTLTFPTGFLFLHLFASLLVLVLEVR